jgi:hypothetical protein
VLDSTKHVEHGELYDAFEGYCKELQIEPVGRSQFGTQLAEAAPSVDERRPRSKNPVGPRRPRYYVGIGLNTQAEPDIANDSPVSDGDSDDNYCVRREQITHSDRVSCMDVPVSAV